MANVLLIPLFFIVACASPAYVERWPVRFVVYPGPQPGYAIKQVIEKEAPLTLVADDGSICRTSAERYAATSRGKLIACVWNLPSLDSTQVPRSATSS
jgi:hypothetical protein